MISILLKYVLWLHNSRRDETIYEEKWNRRTANDSCTTFFSNKGILKECTLYMGMATIIGGKKEDERLLLGKRGLIHQNVMMLVVFFLLINSLFNLFEDFFVIKKHKHNLFRSSIHAQTLNGWRPQWKCLFSRLSRYFAQQSNFWNTTCNNSLHFSIEIL